MANEATSTQQPIPELTVRNLETTTSQLESSPSINATSEPIQELTVSILESTTFQHESASRPDTTTTPEQELSARDFETNTSQLKSPDTTQSIQELLARNWQTTTSQPESASNSSTTTQPLHEQENDARNSGTEQTERTQDVSIRNSGTTTSLSESASSPTSETNIFPSILGPIPPIENKNHLVGPKPTVVTCHICGNKVRTIVYHSATLKTHLSALCLCVFGCGCCAYLPYCLKSSHNVDHYCSYCSSYIGTFFMK